MTDTFGMMRGNAARLPVVRHLSAPLVERWSTRAHGLVFGWREYLPVLASGRRVFLRDEEGRVVCLEAETQDRLWTYPLEVELGALHDDRLFLWAREHELHVVDCATGTVESAIFSSGANRIAVTDRHVFGHGSDHSYGGLRLWALDWRTGRRLWTEVLPDDVDIAGVFCANDEVLVYSTMKAKRGVDAWDGRVIARRAATGEILWSVALDPLVDVASLAGDRVVGCFGERITALRLGDGKILWQRDGGPGYLYGDTYYWIDWRLRYNRVKVATGRASKTIELEVEPRSLVEGFGGWNVKLVSETHLFVQAPSQALVAFTRDRGKYAWSHKPTSADIRGEVVCADDRLYYRNGPDRIYCFGPA